MTDDPATRLRAAQSRIARAMLGGDRCVDPQLGQLTLRPHQRTAVARLLEIIASHRGALLADAVGLGKTYVALGVAREYPSAMILCPAALRGMWERAMKIAGLELPVVSIESMSRGVIPETAGDLLIIDEAHHLRTPGTRRYERVAELARRSRVLLLSATPLQNSRRDLTTVLAIFAGTNVTGWSDRALARLMVRRDDATADQRLPAISGPHALSPGEDDDCLEAIVALPPAVPAADEGVAHALTTISLAHLWTSSRAALVASVRKRLARATALRDAISAGHLPTASELAAWSYTDGALQLAFPLFAPGDPAIDRERLDEQLQRFAAAARALIDRCATTPDPDHRRIELLRTLRRQHPGERIVAFSQYAHTISGLGRMMRGDAGIAIVTASGARIASGTLQRDEVLRQFSAEPGRVHAAERIDLLLTTDLLSEGIDLRGASVIVHLDLPWNPARLEQRVGRARRLGSRHDEIQVFTFVPPAAADRLIELRRRLSAKVDTARTIVGGRFDPFGDGARPGSAVDAGEELRRRMSRWIVGSESDRNDAPIVAAATAACTGWIAAVIVGGIPRLIGDLGAGVTEEPHQLCAAIAQITAPAHPEEAPGSHALEVIEEWAAAREASAGTEQQSAARRAVLERLTQTVARAPRHRRAATIAVAQRTRLALEGAVGFGVERVLATLARSPVDDDAWLHSVEAFGALHSAESTQPQSRDGIVAVIVLAAVPPGDAIPG